ncbi:unnamed protein product [Bursaphelenchus okinawaensis]|uniref:CWH43-like N-terminal domain-containing protein n=1 Tax=Bursaphelenchus okinawaensis TaxID=465554 RepID=A0A811KA85_9BILA|nr:unnamed protein product [Bursaphelenchus okinawaensis]CAG9098643.1 unnamed protein product [Bursaphelenchus okinawaensis]
MSVQSVQQPETTAVPNEDESKGGAELSTFSIYSYVFPVLSTIAFCCAVVGSFYLTLHSRHTTNYLPSFSDIGNYPPERCFFSFFINTAAFFWLCTAYFVYATMSVHIHTFMTMNGTWALIMVIQNFFGLMIGVGLVFIANFQDSNVTVVHKGGYGLFLMSGLFYQWGYIVICFNLRPKLEPNYKSVIISRVVIAFMFTVILLTRAGMTFQPLHKKEDNGSIGMTMRDPNYINQTLTLYMDRDKTLVLNHGIEWAALITFYLFVLTFVTELDGFDVKTVGKVIPLKAGYENMFEEGDKQPATLNVIGMRGRGLQGGTGPSSSGSSGSYTSIGASSKQNGGTQTSTNWNEQPNHAPNKQPVQVQSNPNQVHSPQALPANPQYAQPVAYLPAPGALSQEQLPRSPMPNYVSPMQSPAVSPNRKRSQ